MGDEANGAGALLSLVGEELEGWESLGLEPPRHRGTRSPSLPLSRALALSLSRSLLLARSLSISLWVSL